MVVGSEWLAMAGIFRIVATDKSWWIWRVKSGAAHEFLTWNSQPTSRSRETWWESLPNHQLAQKPAGLSPLGYWDLPYEHCEMFFFSGHQPRISAHWTWGGRISVVWLPLLWPHGGSFLRCRLKILPRSSQTRPDCPVTPATKPLVLMVLWWLSGWLIGWRLFVRLRF